eukprot:c1687_g1_i2.p1 GENE.c1687_g1_i2~~c1687_g1_i2.p1  ORF type:complete len:212 (+),score=21.95 c1687_g1_i2:60-695(+)
MFDVASTWVLERHLFLLTFLKPLPIWLLAWYSMAPPNTSQRKLIAAGMLLSSAGDIFLELKPLHSKLFLAGLSSFLCAHVCYILSFRKDVSAIHLKSAVFVLALVLPVCYFLLPHVKEPLFIPVVCYMTVIGAMAYQALVRWVYSRHIPIFSENAFLSVLGAFTFVFSDTVIAVEKFVVPFKGAKFVIMISYYLAQYAIACGSERVRVKRS